MVDIMEFNKIKRIELINKIINSNRDYRIFFIDVDDVVFNTDPIMQEILEEYVLDDADHKATKRYREEIARETTEDSLGEIGKSFQMLDAILEETEYEYDVEKGNLRGNKRKIKFDPIDYEKVYLSENLIVSKKISKSSIDFIKYMIQNKGPNDFFVFLSHRNPEREGVIKTQRLYELIPEIDLVITLPYHIEVGSKKVNSKALWIKQWLALDNLDNCYLIDNSKSNGKDWRKNGGIDIRYMPNGFGKNDTLDDYLSKLDNLDPYKIQFCLSYIEYVINHPEYVEEVLEKDSKIKRK